MLAIGLISGTSADGIDAALISIEAEGPRLRVETIAWQTTPYPPELRAALLRVASGDSTTAGEICRLHTAVGECFAAAALDVCAAAAVGPSQVAVIGSHGQTVWHEPVRQAAGPLFPPSTLQIGQGQVIAQRTGITTVADFRPRDVAAGGQGAPLVPAVDQLLFADKYHGRILLNIGGISNLTALPAGAGPQPVLGFDTGPGNMLIDGAVTRLTGGRMAYDRDNEIGARGHVNQTLLQELLAEPYYRLPPPKSTGRELFGAAYVADCLARARGLGLDDASVVTTLTALTAVTIADAIERFVIPCADFAEVIAAGGGIHNPLLMRLLDERLAGMGLALSTTDSFGVHPDAKEAVAFAVLAYLTLNGRPGNVPSVTGAAMPLVLGSISPGQDWRGWPAGELSDQWTGRRGR